MDVEKYLNTVTITIPRNVYGDFNEASKLASRIRIGDVALPDDCTFEDNTENFIGEEPSIEYEAEVHNNYFLFRYYYFEVKVPYIEQRIKIPKGGYGGFENVYKLVQDVVNEKREFPSDWESEEALGYLPYFPTRKYSLEEHDDFFIYKHYL